MTSLRETGIFRLRPLVTNFHAKLSTVTEFDPQRQIVCLVSEDNELLLRYTNANGADVLKLISWFKRSCRVIHDVCFDPSGTWLMVLCFDNTLHIIPALFILDSTSNLENNSFSTNEVTSFVIPFVGPHECPNSKSCPNNDSSTTTLSSSPIRLAEYTFDRSNLRDPNKEYNFSTSRIAVPMSVVDVDSQNVPYQVLEPTNSSNEETQSSRSSRKLNKGLDTDAAGSSTERSNSTNNDSVESFMSSSTCPFPICVVWWQTLDQRNKAIIGYSDGSLCFVGLTPNCPFISTSCIENGAVLRLVICKDNSMENVTLLINSSSKEQWKLLLEQKSINYTFPGDNSPTLSGENGRDDWQIVTPIKTNLSERPSNSQLDDDYDESKPNTMMLPAVPNQQLIECDEQIVVPKSGLLPAARARLASLKDGAKKFIALKMKLTDSVKLKAGGSASDDSLNSFAIMESPAMTPEILTTPSGPYFIVQNLRNTFLLSALHSYSDTLSVHRMDVSLIPVFLYKIPNQCQDVLISSNILYSVQMIDANITEASIKQFESSKDITKPSDKAPADETTEKPKLVNGVGVISSAMASIKHGEQTHFNEKSLLGLFSFPDETVINVHRMASFPLPDKVNLPLEKSNDTLQLGPIRSPGSYARLHRNLNFDEFFPLRDTDVMLNDFPKINYDPCVVVTNKNTYFIELSNEPHVIFLNAAIAGTWSVCEEFCNTFDLSFSQCIEFAGDLLLRRKKITQSLFTYNVGRIPPVRTALKLAMFGENFALMQLCALALKCTYILKSNYPSNKLINYILNDADKRHCEDPLANRNSAVNDDAVVNEGKSCSDYTYGHDEVISALQMSASSQFHLSNLLLMTLAERAVKDKNYFPIWNFIVNNLKFHTNMTSIVLCQSGLYSAALLLALVRGACFDVFIGLVSVSNQEFGWYSELNVLLYNLSENVFRETITYLRYVSFDYFNIIQSKLDKIEDNVLQRLEEQMNPFLAVYRPVVSQLSARSSVDDADENGRELLDFCKIFIETYLAIIIQIESHKMRRENFVNALYNFRINYEDNQFAITSSNFTPLSAGCSHCACVIDGSAYFWGSNGVPCVYTSNKPSDPPDPPHVVKCMDILSQLNLEVHAVKCGRQHSLVLTNNGLYSFGMNQLGQLGVGKTILASLQPILVEALDNKIITILESGQYHNAVVADKQLYTWGWGIYGQLGHDDVENICEPKLVSFFNEKNIVQVSLGHAHSLVLCEEVNGLRQLFIFGSNQFGQLGIGQSTDNKSSPNKCLKPVQLIVNDSTIRLIHTKFFTNFVITDSNELYVWGASPQALRLANQIKKRANAKSKIEESFKREINRRNELAREEMACTSHNATSPPKEIIIPVPVRELKGTSEIPKSNSDSKLKVEEIRSSSGTDSTRRHSEPNPTNDNKQSCWQFAILGQTENFENVSNDKKCIEMKVNESTVTSADESTDLATDPPNEIDDIVKTEDITAGTSVEANSNIDQKDKIPEAKSTILDEEMGDHMVPQKVDTSEISGEILQISSGLFHHAIISSTSVLYTWGKNLEHQLGTEDKERRTVIKPFAVESIENPMYVECGADFTLVMTTDYVVKAFGGNASGQCGRDLGPPIDKGKPGKIFCLPTTKRLMRLEGQCVESPCEINLPRPRIQMVSEPTRYLKSVPKFKRKFIVRPALGQEFDNNSHIQHDTITHEFYQDSEDLASSIENISFNDDDSLCSATLRIRNLSSNDISPDEEILSYQPRSLRSLSHILHSRNHLHHNIKHVGARNRDISFCHYIHYCLYIFHGLYDTQRISDLARNNIEFRVRTLMLNYRYVDAFSLCVNECKSAQKSIRIFEYFTKDPSIVPMRRKDLKFFIHQLFIHFISKSLDLNACEEFFISDLDYYLLELAYVLYFNNNNTELEQTMNQKFKVLLEQDFADNQDYNLEDTDMIFESLSAKFKAIICQGLLRMCEN